MSGGASEPTRQAGEWLDQYSREDIYEPYQGDLWLDSVAGLLGFKQLSEWLPGDIPPSYLYAIGLLLVVETGLNLPAYLAGTSVIYIDNPFFILQPIALIAGAIGARLLRRRYHRVVQEMRISERVEEPAPLVDIVPAWLPWTLFILAAGGSLIRFFARGGFQPVYQSMGPEAVIGYVIVNPFIWSPIAAQFLAVYLSIMIIAPWRFARSELRIDFLDPQGLGGLRPIGELVKHTYYYMASGLVLFAFVLYGPTLLSGTMARTDITNIIFTSAWLLTVGSVVFSVLVLHRFMHREKHEELQRLDFAMRNHLENPWNITRYEVVTDCEDTVEEIRSRMQQVSATNEYPATFSIWSQILLSIIVPKLLQLTLATI